MISRVAVARGMLLSVDWRFISCTNRCMMDLEIPPRTLQINWCDDA
jgi:hypothetical protein